MYFFFHFHLHGSVADKDYSSFQFNVSVRTSVKNIRCVQEGSLVSLQDEAMLSLLIHNNLVSVFSDPGIFYTVKGGSESEWTHIYVILLLITSEKYRNSKLVPAVSFTISLAPLLLESGLLVNSSVITVESMKLTHLFSKIPPGFIFKGCHCCLGASNTKFVWFKCDWVVFCLVNAFPWQMACTLNGTNQCIWNTSQADRCRVWKEIKFIFCYWLR